MNPLEVKINQALYMVRVNLPFLAELATLVKPCLHTRVETAGIFDSGRLLLNPDFVNGLSLDDLMFILAHEIYHLALRTSQRGQGYPAHRVNIAHDCIINDILAHELDRTVPVGGLEFEGARNLSLERLLADLENTAVPRRCWEKYKAAIVADEGPLAEKLRLAGLAPARDAAPRDDVFGDVLPTGLEAELFPGDPQKKRDARAQIERAIVGAEAQALATGFPSDNAGQGSVPGSMEEFHDALEVSYRPPWELAMQHWFDSVSPGTRTYARPSRRGAENGDFVLPGRRRDGWTLNIVLDTSGSMAGELRLALGVIQSYCEGAGVESVRLVQCDTRVTHDEIVEPAALRHYLIHGHGGSDLSPAMEMLAQDPSVEAVIVITDGCIDYPATAPPYQVLWTLTSPDEKFRSGYGATLRILGDPKNEVHGVVST